MAGFNIRARHGRMPYDVGEGRTRRLVRNPFQPQPILFEGNENTEDDNEGNGNKPSTDDIVSKASAVLGGVSAIANDTMELAQIADTSGIKSDINELANSDYTGASNNQSLLSQWGSTNWQKNDYTKSDVRGMSGGEMAGKIGDATVQGAMAGLQAGGPWGAAIGGAVGLASSLGGMFAGNRKAKKEAARLNVEATQANRDATNSFTQANNQLAQTTFNNQMANLSAEGGPLQRRKWAELPMRERSDLMRIYIRNGVKNLDEMKSHYDNVYARGGRLYAGVEDSDIGDNSGVLDSSVSYGLATKRFDKIGKDVEAQAVSDAANGLGRRTVKYDGKGGKSTRKQNGKNREIQRVYDNAYYGSMSDSELIDIMSKIGGEEGERAMQHFTNRGKDDFVRTTGNMLDSGAQTIGAGLDLVSVVPGVGQVVAPIAMGWNGALGGLHVMSDLAKGDYRQIIPDAASTAISASIPAFGKGLRRTFKYSLPKNYTMRFVNNGLNYGLNYGLSDAMQ